MLEILLGGLGTGVILGLGGYVGRRVISWWRRQYGMRVLLETVGADLYPQNIFEQALTNFVSPDFVSKDPAELDEPGMTMEARASLTNKLDYVLSHKTVYKYFFVLGGAGTGKTTFLLNYFLRYVRRGPRELQILLIPVSHPDADDRILKCENKHRTILLLDAFDEDPQAIKSYRKRLEQIVKLTEQYSKVIITCRTHFFPRDADIPQYAGKLRGPRRAGVSAKHMFHRFYLAPFTNKQINQYISKKYSLIFGRKQKQRALELINRMPHLATRPMLLAHIDDLIVDNRDFRFSFELYQVMAGAWLTREEGIHATYPKEAILEFCKKLAVLSFSEMGKKGDYQLFQPKRLTELGQEWGLDITKWQLTGRSLLNRDAGGRYKFAHRSIMEYFVVEAFIAGEWDLINQLWTDQMLRFLQERVAHDLSESLVKGSPIPFWVHHVLSPEKRPKGILAERYRLHKQNVAVALYQGAREAGLRNWFSRARTDHFPSFTPLYVDQLTGRKWIIDPDRIDRYDRRKNYLSHVPAIGQTEWRLPTWEEAYALHLSSTLYADDSASEDSLTWTRAHLVSKGLIWTSTLSPVKENESRYRTVKKPPSKWDARGCFFLVSFETSQHEKSSREAMSTETSDARGAAGGFGRQNKPSGEVG